MSVLKVLTVDDSMLMCRMLQAAFTGENDILQVGHASSGQEGLDMIMSHHPDVVTLDVEMPGMNGLEFLSRLMSTTPIPVVMFSSHTADGTEITLKALELGAVDFLQKPRCGLDKAIGFLKNELLPRVRSAATARPRVLRSSLADMRQNGEPSVNASKFTAGTRLTPQPIAPATMVSSMTAPKIVQNQTPSRNITAGKGNKIDIIAIGSSTGGVAAVRDVLNQWGSDLPPVLITQHMPDGYTARFAERLNKYCSMTVTEATDGEALLDGHVYIAPGNAHLKVAAKPGKGYVAVLDATTPLTSGHRPSVDVLFESVAQHAGGKAIGIILTGMGRDGAEGLLKMRQSGCQTFGQNRDTCVVYGMPKAAFEIGAVCQELPLDQIANATVAAFSTTQRMNMRRVNDK